jgi:hypothetical protein
MSKVFQHRNGGSRRAGLRPFKPRENRIDQLYVLWVLLNLEDEHIGVEADLLVPRQKRFDSAYDQRALSLSR